MKSNLKKSILYEFKNLAAFYRDSTFSNRLNSIDLPISFIVASGRSGTKFLAKFLNIDKKHCVYHEPSQLDDIAHLKTLTNPNEAKRYIRYRKYDILDRAKRHECKHYTEVNGYLRLHIPSLREVFPRANFLHLVRDPRDTIRSHLNRDVLTETHPIYKSNLNRPYYLPTNVSWPKLSRFEKICWLWKCENLIMYKYADKTLRFEDIIKNYDCLKLEILDVLGLKISKQYWSDRVAVRVNQTADYKYPEFSDWPEDQKKILYNICGAEMKQFGYIS